MTYINKAFNGQNLWNLKIGSGSPRSDMFAVDAGYSSTAIQSSILFDAHLYEVKLNGHFSFIEPVLTLADVRGLSDSFTIYKDGVPNEFVSVTGGMDFMRYVADNPTLLLPYLQGNDLFQGSDSANVDDGVQSFAGNDTFIGYGSGEYGDQFYGGTGVDTSVYRGRVDEYTIQAVTHIWDNRIDDGTRTSGIEVTDHAQNRDGIDALIQVERLQFSDTNLALDVEKWDNAGSAYRLYKAAFDRAPDEAGLGYWIDVLDDGGSLQLAASGFLISDEFRGLYGANPSDTLFLTKLYNNVLDRDPDQGGLDYWIGKLNGGMSRESALINFSESDENVSNVAALIEHGIHYQPWLS